jgi:predicted DNA-binding transcriptional regulator AlpA
MIRRTLATLAMYARLHVAVAVVGGTALLAARRPKIPFPEDQPTMKVAELVEVLGVSETAVYDSIRRGEIPGVLHVGRRIFLATASIRTWLGLDEEQPAEEADPSPKPRPAPHRSTGRNVVVDFRRTGPGEEATAS